MGQFGGPIIESTRPCFPRDLTGSYCPPCRAFTYEIRYLCDVSHLPASIFKDGLPSWDCLWSPFSREGGLEMPGSQVFPCQTGTWDPHAPSLPVTSRLIRYQMSVGHFPPIQEEVVSTNQVIRTQKGSQVSSEVCVTPRTTGRTGDITKWYLLAHTPPSVYTGETTTRISNHEPLRKDP